MTRAHYYASTVRNLKDVIQYAVFPVCKTLAYLHFKDRAKAEVVASVTSAGVYAALTTTFAGLESDVFDENVRNAVAAELGKKPSELKFSDYLDSKNSIVKKEMDDYQWVQKARYGTDALFLLPAALAIAGNSSPGMQKAFARARGPQRVQNPQTPLETVMSGFNLWDNMIYASKAGYWAYETYAIPKTAHYEVVKAVETIESVNRKFSPNDLVGIVNRNRADQGLPMLDDKAERNAMYPVLEHLANCMNTCDNFNMPEVVYLVGMGKINIFAHDAQGKELIGADGKRVISDEAIQRSIAEIDRMKEVGLEGVTKENARIRREQQAQPGYIEPSKNHGFAERVRHGFLDAQFNFTNSFFRGKDKHTESISPRDGGDVPRYMV